MCVVAHGRTAGRVMHVRRTQWGEDVQALCVHVKEARGHGANASSVDLTARLTGCRKPEVEQASARNTELSAVQGSTVFDSLLVERWMLSFVEASLRAGGRGLPLDRSVNFMLHSETK